MVSIWTAKQLRANWLYVFMAVFLILLSVFSNVKDPQNAATTILDVKATDEELNAGEDKTDIFDPVKIKEREIMVMKRLDGNPGLRVMFVIFSLLIMCIIPAGIFLNIYFIKLFTGKKPLSIRTISPDEPKWNIADIARLAIVFVFSASVLNVFMAQISEKIAIVNNENFSMVFNTLIANVVCISAILFAVMKRYGQNISSLGLTGKNILRNMCYAAAGYIAYIPVLLIIMFITAIVIKTLRYTPPIQPIVQVFFEENKTGVLLSVALFAALFGPVAEEIFFRGFMYPAIKKKAGKFCALMISSAIFAGLHMHIVGFAPIMVLGLLLAYIYEKTGSLTSAITVHVLHNMAMLALIFMVKAVGITP